MESKCKYFGLCGGCSCQHIDYETQVSNKRKMLAAAVSFDVNAVKIFSGEPFFYRNRMDFVFCPDGIGFREKGKWWKVVDVDRCCISNPKINELLKEVRDFFYGDSDDLVFDDFFDMKKKSGTLRYAVIRATSSGDSSISFVVNSDSSRLQNCFDVVKKFAAKTTASNIVVTYVPHNTDVSISGEYFVIKGRDMLRTKCFGRDFEFSVQGFFQNNSEMADEMHAYVHGVLKHQVSLSSANKYAMLLDLYGGVGTFGINNAGLFKKVITVESVAPCIDAAKNNIAINSLKNIEAVLMDAEALNRLPVSKPLFVVTDPPRSGMTPKTIERLKKMDPDLIIYISCNIEQLKKDIPKFREYKILDAAVFDFFPQTNHMESVVVLIRA